MNIILAALTTLTIGAIVQHQTHVVKVTPPNIEVVDTQITWSNATLPLQGSSYKLQGNNYER
jgi:hypothetical protein